MELNDSTLNLLRELHDIWKEYRKYCCNDTTRPIEDEILLKIAIEDEITKMKHLIDMMKE